MQFIIESMYLNDTTIPEVFRIINKLNLRVIESPRNNADIIIDLQDTALYVVNNRDRISLCFYGETIFECVDTFITRNTYTGSTGNTDRYHINCNDLININNPEDIRLTPQEVSIMENMNLVLRQTLKDTMQLEPTQTRLTVKRIFNDHMLQYNDDANKTHDHDDANQTPVKVRRKFKIIKKIFGRSSHQHNVEVNVSQKHNENVDLGYRRLVLWYLFAHEAQDFIAHMRERLAREQSLDIVEDAIDVAASTFQQKLINLISLKQKFIEITGHILSLPIYNKQNHKHDRVDTKNPMQLQKGNLLVELADKIKALNLNEIEEVLKYFKIFIMVSLQRRTWGLTNTTASATFLLRLLNTCQYKDLKDIITLEIAEVNKLPQNNNILRYRDLRQFCTGYNSFATNEKCFASCNKIRNFNFFSSSTRNLNEFNVDEHFKFRP